MKKFSIKLALFLGIGFSGSTSKAQNCGGSFAQYQVLTRTNGENFRQFADLNGDGLTDLITQDNSTVARFYLNTGTGFSPAGSLQLPAFGNVVVAKDFDNDGRVDLLSNSITGTNCLSNQIRIFWNTGQNNAFFNTGLSTNLPLPVNPYCMQSQDIDFNGDGLLDIIATSMPFSPSTNSPGRTYRNNGNRNFTVAADFLWPRDLYGTYTRDFNGDGNADFLVTVKDGWADGLRGMYYYRGNGNGTFQSPIINFNTAPLAGGGIPIQADPNSNSIEDVLMSLNGVSPATIKLGRWNGINNFTFSDISIPTGFATSQSFDFDLDGKQDIMILSSNGQNTLRYLSGNGNGTYSINANNILQASNYNLSSLFSDANPTTQYLSGSNASSLIVYKRNVGQPSAATETANACNTYTWNGSSYNQSGSYTWTGTNASGCDSVVTLNLIINQASASTLNATITEGESYSFNGQSLTTAGTYTATLQNAAGCDSVVTLNLTIEPIVNPFNCEITASSNEICLNQTSLLTVPFQPNSISTTDALNNFIFSAVSPLTQKRTIWKKPNPTGDYEPIFNDNYNRVQVSVGNGNGKIAYVKYKNNLPNGASDSAWVCTSLTNGNEEIVHFLVPNYNRDDVTSLDWSDDNTKLVLTLFNDLYPTITRDGDVFTYTFSNSTLTNITNDFDYLNNMVVFQKGTNNVIYNRNETVWVAWNILLYQQNINGGPATQIVGANGFSFPNSNIFPTDANSRYIYYRRGGNQSNSTRHLYRKDLVSGIESVIVNTPGRSGIEINDSLIAWIDFSNNVHVWNLNQQEVGIFPVNSIESFNLDSYYYQTANDNNYDLQWLGRWSEQPSTSILWSTGETTPSISVSPTETTTYSVSVTEGNQTCNSEVTITVNQPSAVNETATACNTYTWNGSTYAQSGSYTWTGTNAAGCDSVVTLNLTITPQPEQPQLACWQTATFNTTTCDWDVTGTQPQQPSNLACWQTAFFNANTCNWEVTGTQSQQPSNLACWQTATFNTTICDWDVTGTQPAQPTNLACYETATFNTENCSWVVNGSPAPALVTNASACGTYTWAANGQAYSASGQYSLNSNCQDYTLNLTINQSSAASVNASIIEGETYSFNGQSLTTAGTYTATLQNAAGCDSVVTLNLTVNPFVDEINCTISTSDTELCLGENVTLTMEVSGQSPAQVLSTSEYNVVGSYNGKTYLVTNNAMTWFEAKTFAENLPYEGATLAVFETLEENNAVDGLTNQYNEWLWFGLFQDLGSSDYSEPFGGWSWVNGAELTYSNWEAGEPNNIGGENFAHLKRYPNGKWNDHYAEVQSKAIIEINAIQSSSYLWNNGETTQSINVSPATTSTFSCTYTSGNQTCTSEVTITVNQPSAATVNATITEGETYSFNGQNLTTAGTYTATLQNAAGCDSVLTLNLTVNPAPSGCFASSFSNFVQGTTANGLTVSAVRSNAAQALNQPETVVDGVVNFVSLGFGGSITLAFEAPIANGAGADIRIDEATWGNNPCNRYPERADVFASQDGSNFVYLGQVCQDATLDLGVLSWAQYIRIVDASDLLSFSADADGYDVNGVECLNGTATVTGNDGLVGCSLQEIVSYNPGPRKNGTPVTASRRDESKALGNPQNNNTINFVSLGFGGTLVAKFDYVVFNQAGNDLRVTETSFGNPSCTNYPEKARISLSLDNVSWVEVGELCQDGEVDLGSLPYAQYIKIQDASPMSSNRFNGAADGYDVDAVVVLNNGCGATARFAEETAVEETMDFNVYPNPIEDYAIISLSELDRETEFDLVLVDAAGRIVMKQPIVMNNEGYTLFVNDLARGIYTLTLSNAEQLFVKRLVK